MQAENSSEQIDSYIPEKYVFSNSETTSGFYRDWHPMIFRSKPKSVASTPISDFIRNASSAEKKRVYKIVLEKATERQRRVSLDAAQLCANTAD